jgi:hypothetical protein
LIITFSRFSKFYACILQSFVESFVDNYISTFSASAISQPILSQHHSEAGEKYEQKIELNEATKQLDVSVVGSNPKLGLVDPNNRTYVGDSQDGKSVIIIEDPEAGEWILNAEDTSEFTTDVEVTEEILMDFGFSAQKPGSLTETLKSPIKGMTLC